MRAGPLLATLVVLAVPAALAHGTHVGFALTLFDNGLPSHRECVFHIVPLASATDVLRAAVATGCIRSWSGDAAVVQCIDDLCSAQGWALYVNETRAPGVYHHHRFGGNESIEWVFTDRNLPDAPPVPPIPPVPPLTP